MNTDPQRPLTPEEERKANRALTILYIAMGVMVVIPFIVMWWVNRNK